MRFGHLAGSKFRQSSPPVKRINLCQKINSMKNFSLNFILIIVILLLIANIGYSAYFSYQRSNFCAQFIINYTESPPINTPDYTRKDYVFNELCSPTNDLYNFSSNLILVGLIIYLLRRKYKKEKIKTPSVSNSIMKK